MRIVGQNHVVRGNFMEGCEYGISLYAGEHFETDLTGKFKPILRDGTPLGRVPRYGRVRNVLVERNTMIASDRADLIVGGAYKSGWPEAQRVLLPEGVKVIDNQIIRAKGGAAVEGPSQDKTPPLDRFTFAPNEYRGNTVVGGTVELDAARGGFAVSKETANSAPPTPPPPTPRPLTPADVGPTWRK
jgi:poly(beta-D-mannuronate) lyase